MQFASEQIRSAIVKEIVSGGQRDAAGTLSDDAMSVCIREATVLVDNVSLLADREVEAIHEIVFPDAILQSIVNGGTRRPIVSLHDLIGSNCMAESFALLYSQSVYNYSAMRIGRMEEVRPIARIMPSNENHAATCAVLVNACSVVLDTSACSVVYRLDALRYASARNTMRTVFSMMKSIVFRDTPRGGSIDLAVDTSNRGDAETLRLSDPPYTREHMHNANTDTDTIMVSRNSWLRRTWTLFVALAHGAEKERDLPIDDETVVGMSDRERNALRGRTVEAQKLSAISAMITAKIYDVETIRRYSQQSSADVSETARRNAMNVLRSLISDVASMNMALMCYYVHSAIRLVECAGSRYTAAKIDGQWPFRDPELCIWLWPQWRGSFDRTRANLRDAESTKPTAAVYREDARHLHSFRQTRTGATPLPARHWRPNDPLDTAACVQVDTYIGRTVSNLSYAIGVANASAEDAGTNNETIDELLGDVSERALELRSAVAKCQSELDNLVDGDVAPTYHQRAMVEAAVANWPGDMQWTLSNASSPTSAFAKIVDNSDGTRVIETESNRERQFSLCRRLDQLQADLMVAKKLLRVAEAMLGTKFDEARNDSKQSKSPVSTRHRVDPASLPDESIDDAQQLFQVKKEVGVGVDTDATHSDSVSVPQFVDRVSVASRPIACSSSTLYSGEDSEHSNLSRVKTEPR